MVMEGSSGSVKGNGNVKMICFIMLHYLSHVIQSSVFEIECIQLKHGLGY